MGRPEPIEITRARRITAPVERTGSPAERVGASARTLSRGPLDGVAARPRVGRRARAAKRALDLAAAVSLLLLLSPLIAALTVLVRLTSRGPAVLVQTRVGKGGRPFGMYKLRTMHDGAERQEVELAGRGTEGPFFKPRNDPRVTAPGRVLRKLSLDELPQLVNVVRGDMSLVGPRPLLRNEFEQFPPGPDRIRFSVRPGITGLWQVNGRNLCTDAERLMLDRRYVEEWSLKLDLLILARTVPAVLSGRGAV